MAEVFLSKSAEDDYAVALNWYLSQSQDAAEGFRAELLGAIGALEKTPDRFPKWDDRHRFLLFKKYPYRIIYRSTNLQRLVIVAVAHTSRDPSYWVKR